MTDLRQAEQAVLDAWDDPAGMKDLCVAMDALRTALEQQAEPVAWDKPSASFNASASFNEWWYSYRHDPANPFAEGGAAYWAWAGWKAAQRQWVGLTDDEILEAAGIDGADTWVFETAYAIEAKLKQKNNT
jgi:hypothetical protein